jgi:HEAT repeat protein
LTTLRDEDGARRAQVASAVGRLGGPEATPALVMALGDPDLRVRGAAAEALERAGYDDVALAAKRPSTDELLAALRGPDDDLRVEAAMRLGSHVRPDVADALAGALDHDRPDVRRAALLALADHGDARAIALLAEGLFEVPFELDGIDSEVASALAKIPDPEAARVLIPALDSEDWDLEGITEAIRGMDGVAVGPLVAAFHEVDWEFQQTIASVLGSMGAPAIPEVVPLLQTDLRGLAAQVLTTIGELAVQPVAERLEAGSTDERAAALAALGGIGSRAAVDQIGPVFRSDPQLTDAAGSALSEVGEAAVPTLIEALGHERTDVRRRAANALGEIGDPRALGPLDTVLDDPDAGVRMYALITLGDIGEPSAQTSVQKRVDDPDVVVRLIARRILDLPDEGPVEQDLVTALRSSDADLMAGAGALLAQRGLVDPLIEALSSEDPSISSVAEAALRDVDDEALAPLGELGAGPDARLRLVAARILAERGDVEAIRYLLRTLAEEDRDDRDEIIELILRVPHWTGPELLASLHDPELGAIAADLLTRIGSIAVEPVRDMLNSDDERDQTIAARILVGIGRPAVRPLIELVGGGDASSQLRAVDALGAIGGPRAVTVLSVVAENAYAEEIDAYPVALRLAAVNALATNPDPLAQARLRRVADTKNRKVRKAAQDALR